MIVSNITSAGNPTFPTNAQSGATITLDATSDSGAGGSGADGAFYHEENSND